MTTDFRATNTNLSYSLPFLFCFSSSFFLNLPTGVGQCVTNMRMKRHQKKKETKTALRIVNVLNFVIVVIYTSKCLCDYAYDL